ncbi:MAG: Uma2 family endonuclease [Lachnospiraceae bacterium]|nr:Uma2 family endonuclease [Lachnospiraceae bacterium]
MTIDEMIAKKKEYGFSCEYIADKSRVPLSTVQKIFSKITTAPRRKTLEALWAVFAQAENTNRHNKIKGCSEDLVLEDGTELNCVREDASDYGSVDGSSALKVRYLSKEDNTKTLDDYLALPEGTRVELIDGVFYDMASPVLVHQRISGLIFATINNYIAANKGSCVPFDAPTDVQLDCDNKTIVQPDILVVCNRDKLQGHRVVGAPDFIVEVLSPSNWHHDVVRKLRKYKNAGVREYWIVNPENLTVLVYDFSKSDMVTEYSFNDEVPINIWDGKCKINFKEIFEQISFML